MRLFSPQKTVRYICGHPFQEIGVATIRLAGYAIDNHRPCHRRGGKEREKPHHVIAYYIQRI
jgi:hypothetical protein